jgi:hypothetical protein
MNKSSNFWNSMSPLGGLSGLGLLIMSSARLAWAITVSGCLFWVYGFTVFTFSLLTSDSCRKIFPQQGRLAIFICIASFYSCVYFFLVWVMCPFAAMEVFLPVMLVPFYCAEAGIFEKLSNRNENKNLETIDYLSEAVSKALVLSCITLAFSILREPLSYCSLTFPGSSRGLITIMYFKSNALFPVGIFASSSGALLLLGFFIALFQYSKESMYTGE